jgi:hypothetical protein
LEFFGRGSCEPCHRPRPLILFDPAGVMLSDYLDIRFSGSEPQAFILR